jgi:hypothetical protein
MMSSTDVASVLGLTKARVRQLDDELKPLRLKNGWRSYEPTRVALVAARLAQVRRRRAALREAVTHDTEPTRRQRELHDKMLRYQRMHAMPPTHRELAELLGVSSTNGITDHLVALEKRGLVRHRPGAKARGWVALNPQSQEGTP